MTGPFFETSRFSIEQLDAIAHELGHYDRSHGNLALFKLPRYIPCDDRIDYVPEVGYRDARAVFAELARLRRELAAR